MTDTDEVSDWARDALIWCTDNGIMNGSANYDGSRSIDPQRNILRCEAAKMIRVAFTQALS